MASKPPGVLGTASNPGYGPNRQTVGFGTFRSPSISGSHTLADLEHRATHLAHSISRAIGWNETQSAAYNLVGRDSFTAGVIVGMGENLAKTVVAAVELVYTLALADYWESKQDHSFMARLRSSVFTTMSPGLGLAPMIAGQFWPGFDQKAKDAFDERGAIIEAIKHAFTHPKDFFKDLTKSQEAKAKEFVSLIGQKSLSGNFHAGVLMGELLFDLLMVIDLAVGLAKLAMAVPRLARYTEDMARLAREFRGAKLLERKAVESAPAGPRITQAEKDALAAKMKGPPPPAGARAVEKPNDPPPDKPPERVEDAAAPVFDGESYLAQRRQDMGLPAADTAEGQKSTLAVLQVNGKTYDGINAGLQDPKSVMTLERVNPITIKHAEADAVQAAINDGAQGTASRAEMWVDQDPCKACGVNNGLGSLARNLGVDQLVVNSPSGTTIFTPTGK